jgi:serine/threonine-protein kinase
MTNQVAAFEKVQPGFWVVPPDEVVKAGVSDPRAAGRRFGTTVAVTGRLERDRDDVRLTLTLSNTGSADPSPIQTAEIAGAIADLSALQTAAVRRIGEMLELALLPAESRAEDQGEVPSVFQHYVEGRGHLLRYEQMSELEAAASAFDTAIELDSTYAPAHAGLAEAYWRMFRDDKNPEWIEKARRQCDRALALDSTRTETQVVYGNVLRESGEYESAVAAFQRAIAIDSTAAGVYNGLAASYARLGRLEEAEAAFQRAIRVKSDYWGGYSDLGLFYYRNGRFEEAAEQYRRITELTPDNYLAFNNLGGMYYYLERWDDARTAFERSIDIQPSDRAYLNLGTIHYIEGDYETAARLSEQAVELNPNNYLAWAALGNASYWSPDGRARAMEAYRRAIDLAEARLALDPRNDRVRASLSGYYSVVGEREKAIAYADSALAHSSSSPFVVYFAGYVYEQLGERERALELIGRAVELGYPIDEIERDPWLVDLRADPRYRQMLDTQE